MEGAGLDLIKVCRWLNRNGVSAAPCPWLPAISIFDDELYEGHDLDGLRPRDRLRIRRLLVAHGLAPRGARAFEGHGLRVELSTPPRSLASDPSEELRRVLAGGRTIAAGTPTQVLLATLHREGATMSPDRSSDLVDLLYEQPANLEKVDRFARGAPWERTYLATRPELKAAQETGTELRRQRRFRSRLPR
ncbi:MAG TPA: hypothetical protein VMT85_25075 [Thermoanaerobaculia bacterium]|nr:hypothetical protein [Thermoanaerobaculia bacterium]